MYSLLQAKRYLDLHWESIPPIPRFAMNAQENMSRGNIETEQLVPFEVLQRTLVAIPHFPHWAFQFELGAVALEVVLQLQL